MRDAHEKLIAEVEKIDADAAKYLREEAHKLPDFERAETLSACLFWRETPQGHDYWSRICDRLPNEMGWVWQ